MKDNYINYKTSDFSIICLLRFFQVGMKNFFWEENRCWFEFQNIPRCKEIVDDYFKEILIIENIKKFIEIQKGTKQFISNSKNNDK